MGVNGIETKVLLRPILQVDILIDKTWLIEGVADILVVNIPESVLAVKKLEVPVDKDLIVVETYPLIKLVR